MASCEHKHIAKVLGLTMQDDLHLAIIMPVYAQSLADFLNGEEEIRFLDALRLVWQTAAGFNYLSMEGIIHQDQGSAI